MHKYLHIFNKAFLSLYLDEVVDKKNYTEVFSKANATLYWNAVDMVHFPEGEDIEKHIASIETDFNMRSLTPAFWLTDEDTPSHIQEILEHSGYSQKGVDFWMSCTPDMLQNIEIIGLQIKEVSNEKELQDFISIFLDAFGDDDGKYTDAFKRKSLDLKNRESSKLYVGYIDDIPVTGAGFVKYEDYGILHSVGTQTAYRGKGYAAMISSYTIRQCNAKQMLLQTEYNSTAHRVYSTLGFTELMKVKMLSLD